MVSLAEEPDTVAVQRRRLRRFGTLRGGDDGLQAPSGKAASRHRLDGTAPGVVLGIIHQSGADGIHVDAGGHAGEGVSGSINEDALEAFFPKGALAARLPVELLGETLLEQVHERAHVPHAGEEALPKNLALIFRQHLQPMTDSLGETPAVSAFQHTQQLLVRWQNGGALRDFQQDVEVVYHDAEGDAATQRDDPKRRIQATNCYFPK